MAIGSVKTNIGHLEAAAGIAGLIKLISALVQNELPPHINLREVNPFIPLEDLPLTVPTTRTPWISRGGRPRVAGVSSFGFSGTNAHVVVEEAPARERPAAEAERPSHLLVLSARSEEALRELAGRYERHLEAAAELRDVCYTAATGRAHFEQRAALVCEDVQQARQELRAVARGGAGAGLRGRAMRGRPKVAFLFGGAAQGSAAGARELLETQPTYRRAVERCAEVLGGTLERPLEEALREGSDDGVSQFARAWGQAELWRSWGVEPDVVMGHGAGEVAAACAAGALQLEDGLKLARERARLMRALPEGAMAAVFAPEARVARAVASRAEAASIAAVNGEEEVVVSGEAAAVEQVVKELEGEGVRWRWVSRGRAYRSPLAEEAAQELEGVVASELAHAPQVPMVCSVTGVLAGAEVTEGRYWARQAREPAQIARCMAALEARGVDAYVEVGGGTALVELGRRRAEGSEALWLPTAPGGGWRALLESVGALYTRGVGVDWWGFDRDYARQKVALPTYPFQRTRHWIEEEAASSRAAEERGAGGQQTGHPLLGQRIDTALDETLFEAYLAAGGEQPAYLRDHRVHDMVVVPAAAYAEMGLAAAGEALGEGAWSLAEVAIEHALELSGERVVQLAFDRSAEAFRVFSAARGEEGAARWTRHAEGKVRQASGSAGAEPLAAVRRRCDEEIPVEAFYDRYGAIGLTYGKRFRGVVKLWRGRDEALGQVQLPAELERDDAAVRYRFHPALLDACFQLGGALGGDDAAYMPVWIDELMVHKEPGGRLWCHASSRPGEAREVVTADYTIYDEAGAVVAQVAGLRARRTSAAALEQALRRDTVGRWQYEVQWRAAPAPAAREPERGGRWLVFADEGGTAAALVEALEAREQVCVVVRAGDSGCDHSEGGAWRVDPREPEHLQRVLTEERAPFAGVVYLWPLDVAPAEETTPQSLQRDAARACGGLLHLVQALARTGWSPMPRLHLVTRGAQAVKGERGVSAAQATALGLARAVEREHPEIECARIDLDPSDEALEALVAEVWGSEPPEEAATRGGQRYIARLARRGAGVKRLSTPSSAAYQLVIPTRGLLDNLELRAKPRGAPGPGEVEIQVRATGLNFRDVMNALGAYPGDPGALGGECAGTVTAVGEGVEGIAEGDAVVALSSGCFASHVTALAELVVRKPKRLSFEEAATIPVVFLTAFYGLHPLARLKGGEKVLIHAAAGGVGMAAVQLARQAGAEIYGTAGSERKRDLLRRMGVKQVMSSRSLLFAQEVREATGGAGVDVVLNSLSGEYIEKSAEVLAKGGRFLEIGKVGIWGEEEFAQATDNAAYHVIALDQMMAEEPAVVGEMLKEVMRLVDEGALSPLPLETFPLEDAVGAFRHMQQAKHAGKVVVVQGQELPAEGCYLVTGGLGALGLRVARWMVERGARRLALMGRRQATEEARAVIAELQEAGAHVEVLQGDVANTADVARALGAMEARLGRLRGIVHAAGVLDDGVLTQQTWERFAKVMAPKVWGAWGLHEQTRDRSLDFFVSFSSIASVLGSAGQGNYAAANAFEDALAHHQRACGTRGLSINWGPWGEAGMAAEVGSAARREAQGMRAIPPERGLEALGQLLSAGGCAQVVVVDADWHELARAPGAPALLADVAETSHETRARPQDEQTALVRQLEEAPPGARRELLSDHVSEQVARVLGMDPSQVDAQQPLMEMGVDSLLAVELRNALRASTGQSLPTTLVFDYPSVDAIAKHLAQLLGQADNDDRVAREEELEDAELTSRAEQLVDLSEDETSALIDAKLASLEEKLKR